MRRTGLIRTIWVLGTICLVVALVWAGDRDRRGPGREGREARDARAAQAERSSGHAEKADAQLDSSRTRAPATPAPSWQPRAERPAPAPRPETVRGQEQRDWTPAFRGQADRGERTAGGSDGGWTPGRSLRFGPAVEGPTGEPRREAGQSGLAPEKLWSSRETTPGVKAEAGGSRDEDWTPGRSLRSASGAGRPDGWKPGARMQREEGRGDPALGRREEPGERAPGAKAEPGRGDDEDWAPGRSLRSADETDRPGGQSLGGGLPHERGGEELGFGGRSEPGEKSGGPTMRPEGGRDEDWTPGRSLRSAPGAGRPDGWKPGGIQREEGRGDSALGRHEEPGERAPGAKAEPGRGDGEDWVPGRSLHFRRETDRPAGEKARDERPRSEALRPGGRGADEGRGPGSVEKFAVPRPGTLRDEEAIRKLAGSPPRPGDPPRLFVNGSELRFPEPPRLHDGHPVAPLRPFVEKVGGRMWYDHKTTYWHVCHGDVVIRFRIGDRRAYCGDRLIILVVAPYVIGGYVYCPIEPFAFFFGVRYYWHYYWAPPLYYGPWISERRAISIARNYLMDLDEYPYRVLYVEAYRKRAPANRFWEAVTSGYEPLWDAPRRVCWVVEFGYRRGYRDAWKQVFVDAHTGRVVGGWDSEYDYYDYDSY